MMELTTIAVRGTEFKVYVNSDGQFWSEVDGAQLKAESLADLTDKLNRATTVKVSVPFVTWGREGAARLGICTGKHAANRNYLVRWEDGKTQQVSGWDIENGCVDPKHREAFQKLALAVNEAVKARDQFLEKHRFNVRAVVDAAIENAFHSEKDAAS